MSSLKIPGSCSIKTEKFVFYTNNAVMQNYSWIYKLRHFCEKIKDLIIIRNHAKIDIPR